MSLLDFCHWIENTFVGTTIRDSLWLFPVIESVHLLGLGLIGGTILVIDLRLLGLILRGQSIAWLAREMKPWLTGALAVMIVTGVLLFASEATKCYESPAFWIKIGALILAIIYTFTLQPAVVANAAAGVKSALTKTSALGSLTLWALVAWGGRWIGFGG